MTEQLLHNVMDLTKCVCMCVCVFVFICLYISLPISLCLLSFFLSFALLCILFFISPSFSLRYIHTLCIRAGCPPWSDMQGQTVPQPPEQPLTGHISAWKHTLTFNYSFPPCSPRQACDYGAWHTVTHILRRHFHPSTILPVRRWHMMKMSKHEASA